MCTLNGKTQIHPIGSLCSEDDFFYRDMNDATIDNMGLSDIADIEELTIIDVQQYAYSLHKYNPDLAEDEIIGPFIISSIHSENLIPFIKEFYGTPEIGFFTNYEDTLNNILSTLGEDWFQEAIYIWSENSSICPDYIIQKTAI